MQLLNTISNNRIVNRHGVKIVWTIATVCLLLLLFNIVYTIKVQSSIKENDYAAQPLLVAQNNNRPNYRASDITRANLFGAKSRQPVVRQAPKTTLDLTLEGILWASDSSMARAIIRSGKNKTNLYSIGESIQGAGATIKEIRDGEVILNRNGAAESLPLIRKTSSGNRQLITYSGPNGSNTSVASNNVSARTEKSNSPQDFRRSSAKPRSRNGKNRKIRKPNFSGLDKALKKMGEI